MIKQKKEGLKIDFFYNEELVLNQYALKSVTSAMITIAIVWALNMINIFVIDKEVTTSCFVLCLIVYLIGRVVCKINKLSKWWIKYFILLWVVCIVTIITMFLTFHAVLVFLLPIVYTTMYSSKKMMVYTYILTVISITFSVYAGYYFGICDTNMVLLPGKPMEDYLIGENVFALQDINNNVLKSLGMYWVLPRCMICAAFTLVCSNVSKIISLNVSYAKKMENMAGTDGMTGLYNRSKYLDMVGGGYKQEDKLAVIYWDINFLKRINDTIGHEAGDKLILAVAESIRSISSENDNGYRIGGDEFIMVMRGVDEKSVLRKIQEWEKRLSDLQKSVSFPISVSVGYAFGKGEDLDNIIHAADQMMYENKRAVHQKEEMKK